MHEESVLMRVLLEIKEDIGEIKAKVESLVGPTGTNGRVGTLEKEVAVLKGTYHHQRGRNSVFLGALTVLGALAGVLIKWGLDKFFLKLF